jgi:carboxypeptidase Taq
MTPQAAYTELLRRAREEFLLESCQSLLGWDELTYMPPGGVTARANQMAYLAGLQHEKATDPRIGELLASVEGSGFVNDPFSAAAVNVREIRRTYDRLSRLPRSLVEELAHIAPLSQQQWATSRQEADFSSFCPWLEKIVALQRQEAECLGYNGNPYDALLGNYEPGARSADLARLFDALRAELTTLLGSIAGSRKRRKHAILKRNYLVERQQSFALEAAAALGFDFERGRLDTSVHPFSTHVAPGDCRIAIRYNANYFSDAFFALLHEVGHGLYEQGLDPEHEATPLGSVNSLGLHEAQARLWENLVGRGLPFWKYFFPRARQAFPEALGKVPLGDFYLAINHVEPSCNRVQADEVTYNLHILVRFELEQAMIGGDLAVADLPSAWNEAYQKTLGVPVPNDAEGCLQDGHWSEGLIGYFPTYTLGNLFAAQLFARARADLGNLDAAFAKGDFSGLLDWLRAKVYRQGSRYPAPMLIEKITDQPPDHRPLVEAMKNKFTEVYGL